MTWCTQNKSIDGTVRNTSQRISNGSIVLVSNIVWPMSCIYFYHNRMADVLYYVFASRDGSWSCTIRLKYPKQDELLYDCMMWCEITLIIIYLINTNNYWYWRSADNTGVLAFPFCFIQLEFNYPCLEKGEKFEWKVIWVLDRIRVMEWWWYNNQSSRSNTCHWLMMIR